MAGVLLLMMLAGAVAASPMRSGPHMPLQERASDETILDEAPDPDACGFVKMMSGMKPIIGAQMVTSSPRWGRITRVDFTLPGRSLSPLVNRLMCWSSTKDGPKPVQMAIGQKIAPLPDTAPKP